jgi:hypothetical protein
LHHFTITLGYLHLSPALPPVEQRDTETYFHNLVVLLKSRQIDSCD